MKNTNVRIRGFEHGVVAACISALLAFVFIDAFAETVKQTVKNVGVRGE